jgi:hypothetical protein
MARGDFLHSISEPEMATIERHSEPVNTRSDCWMLLCRLGPLSETDLFMAMLSQTLAIRTIRSAPRCISLNVVLRKFMLWASLLSTKVRAGQTEEGSQHIPPSVPKTSLHIVSMNSLMQPDRFFWILFSVALYSSYFPLTYCTPQCPMGLHTTQNLPTILFINCPQCEEHLSMCVSPSP